MKDLKQKAVRGGAAKISSQGASFVIRMGSLMIMARLLDPRDFGLVGMVTAVTGVFNVFKDMGLSAAAVQRASITEEQSSTLFWINLLVGGILGLLVAVTAPLLASFYREPKLLGVTLALATGFLFNAAGVQHSAILERQLRFVALSVIDVISLVTSVLVGIAMALRGYGYWSLVATATVTPFFSTLCLWVVTHWLPGRPRRGIGIGPMMRFGGTLTTNGLLMYIASNFEKVLLGRFWGADTVGIYGRAYQLINIPNDNLNSAATGVAFATLSRLKDDPGRFKSYFLKGYTLVLSITVPVTIACLVLAHDMISVFLGSKWTSAIVIFRLLAPTTLAFALINPMGWLLMSLGLVKRGLKMSLVLAPLMITGYAVGLPYGPKGVALAYSVMMSACAIPLITWAVRGTVISVRDVLTAASRPFLSGVVGAALVLVMQFSYGQGLSPLPRLILGVALVLVGYLGTLLYVMRQKQFYVEVLRGFWQTRSVSVEEPFVFPA